MPKLDIWDALQQRSLSNQETNTLISAWGRAALAGDVDETGRLRASFAHSHHCCGPNVADPSLEPDPPKLSYQRGRSSARLEQTLELPLDPPDPYPIFTSPRPTRVSPQGFGTDVLRSQLDRRAVTLL